MGVECGCAVFDESANRLRNDNGPWHRLAHLAPWWPTGLDDDDVGSNCSHGRCLVVPIVLTELAARVFDRWLCLRRVCMRARGAPTTNLTQTRQSFSR